MALKTAGYTMELRYLFELDSWDGVGLGLENGNIL